MCDADGVMEEARSLLAGPAARPAAHAQAAALKRAAAAQAPPNPKRPKQEAASISSIKLSRGAHACESLVEHAV